MLSSIFKTSFIILITSILTYFSIGLIEYKEKILSKKIQWLRCSICNEKWSVSSTTRKKFDQHKNADEEKLTFTVY